MYAFISRRAGKASIILRIDDNQKGIDALENAGFRIPGPAEIYS